MTGYEKAKTVANKIKEEVQEKEVNEALNGQVAPLPQSAVTNLGEQYFADNINVGLEELTQEDMPVPTLSLIQRTSKVTDENGRPYVPGSFYYKATRQVYTEVDISMLVFTKSEMPNYTNKEVMDKVYIFLGALSDTWMPFKMFLRGSGAGAARQFLGEVKTLKKPMYALRVKLTSVKRENEFGIYFVPQFQIVDVRTNPEEIVMLENLAKTYSHNREKLKQESVEETNGEVNKYSPDIPF